MITEFFFSVLMDISKKTVEINRGYEWQLKSLNVLSSVVVSLDLKRERARSFNQNTVPIYFELIAK